MALLGSGCTGGGDGLAGNGFTGSGGSHEPPRGLCRDGWCWINPTPQGRTLSAITAVGANDWWAVGDLGTTVHLSPQGTTLDIAVPSPHGLKAVWSAAADDVWAIGDTAMRWQGQGWNAVTSAAIPASLNAVGGTGPDDVWVVGSGDGYTSRGNPAAGAAHYNGAAWTAVPMDDLPALKELSPRFSLLSVYAAADDDVWFSTDLLEAPLIHYDGQSFSWVRAPLVGTLSARILCLAGRGPLDVWAAGEGGTVLHFDGAWHDVGIGVTVGAGGAGGAGGSAAGGSVVSLALLPSGDVIALDDRGTIRRWHDQQWSVEVAPAIVTAVAADADGNLLAVGAGGAMARYDRKGWHVDTYPLDATGIWGASDDDVWVVASTELAHWDGSDWTRFVVDGVVRLDGAPATRPLFSSVWSSGPRDVYVAGADGFQGLVMHNGGNGWAPVSVPIPDGFRIFYPPLVGGTAADDVWLVGAATDYGSIHTMTLSFHFNGVSWTRTDDVPVVNPALIWIEPTTGHPYVAGQDTFNSGSASMASRDGTAWREWDFSGSYLGAIASLWGTGPADLWASAEGSLIHFDGDRWSRSGVSGGLIAGRGANDLWVTTNDGVAHFDGQSWTHASSPLLSTPLDLRLSATAVWLVVEGGVQIYSP